MANILTGLRVVCCLGLLFCKAFSPGFYALYLSAGISDMLDGPAARKMNTVSEFGSRFDTAADLIMVVVCFIKLVPVLAVPVRVWWCAGVVALIKAVNVISGFAVQKRLVVLHTAANKIAGALLFALPLTVSFIDLRYSAAAVCAAAAFAAVQEGHFIRTGRGGQPKAEDRDPT